MANETLGASFSIDVTNLKTGLAQANRLIKESESEFRAAAAGMDDWTQSESGLNSKIKSLNQITEIQRKKVEALQKEYDRLIADGLDPASKEAVELRTKINNETAAMEKSEKETEELTEALRKLKEEQNDAGEAADDASEKTGGFGAVARNVAVNSIAAIATACAGAVTAFFGLAESTREARANMAKLETGFTTAGLSAEAATNTYNELYGVLGDDGQATEAAAHLAQLANNEEDLAKWTNIATGVYATFGDSLPIEGLTEAANETAKTGALTGGLADALNWAGVSEDEFQASLDACTTEQERQALITETLNGLYSEAADAYAENNAEVIAANKAQAQLNDAMNDLGAIAEPIMTTLKTLAADLLTTITPFVSLMGEGLAGALNGTAGAADSLADGLTGVLTTIINKIVEMLPFIIQTIVAIVPKLLTALLGQLPTILQTLINMVIQVVNALSAMLPTIIAAIMQVLPQLINALIASIPQLLQAAIQLLMAIVQAIPTIITALIGALPSVIQTIITAITTSIPLLLDAAIQLLMAIIDAIPTIIDALILNLPLIIDAIINGVLDALPLLLDAAIKLLFALIDAIPVIVRELVGAMPQIISTILSSIAGALPKLFSTATELFGKILSAAGNLIKTLPSKMGEIITSIVGGLTDGISSITEVGGDIIRGLWDGISDMAGWIGKKIKGFGESVLGGLKDFFGIKSPSRVMSDQVGKNLALGIGEGFEKNIADVNKDITDAMNFDDPNYPTGGTPRRGGMGGVTVYQTNNYKQAYTSRYEQYKSKQQLAATARLMKAGAV